MTVTLLPGPEAGDDDRRQDDADRHHEEARAEQPRGPDKKRHIASEDECLAVLSQLPALAALRTSTTAQANTIRGTYTAILQHYRHKRGTDDRSGVADDALLDMLSRYPEMANLLEPMLSAEQIASIMARAQEGARGTS